MITIENLIKKIEKYMPGCHKQRIRDAYRLARKAQKGCYRFSGRSCFSHSLEVANILLDLKPDENTIIAALLHDIPKTNPDTLKEINEKFGSEVTMLVSHLLNLSAVRSRKRIVQIENLRKMFLAVAQDLRVVLIKLAERLHNMKTLQYLPEKKQKQLARETLEVFAPIAARLGVYLLKSELENVGFKYLHPEKYADIHSQIKKRVRAQRTYMSQARGVLKELLREYGIKAKVEGRVKTIYSIYRKLKRKNKTSVDEIFDLFAMRIILPASEEGVANCYRTLGLIHNKWAPLANRFKDYIAVPKINGYRSLHTTIMGLCAELRKEPTEIQIRTESMHREAEFGVASHWWYEDSKHVPSSLVEERLEVLLGQKESWEKVSKIAAQFSDVKRKLDLLVEGANYLDDSEIKEMREKLAEKGVSEYSLESYLRVETMNGEFQEDMKGHLEWLKRLSKLQEDIRNSGARGYNLQVDIFEDRIFVFTPTGEVKDFPEGSTPVDFAYSVDLDLGHCCEKAEVNGNLVPLDYRLNSGEVVRIITRQTPSPNRYWLSFTKTLLAKDAIKSWFGSLDREQLIKEGKELVNQQLYRLNESALDAEFTLLEDYGGKYLSLEERENILELVGRGALSPIRVLNKALGAKDIVDKREHREVKSEDDPELKAEKQVSIAGEIGIPVRFALCCSPKFGDDIIGYVRRGGAVSIHKKGCRMLHKSSDRLIDAAWWSHKEEPEEARYQVKLTLEADDRVGFIKDVTSVISDASTEISAFEVNKEEGKLKVSLVLFVSCLDAIEKMWYRMENISGVVSVERG